MTKRSGKRGRRKRPYSSEFKTLADVNLVRRAVREGWPTSTGNQQRIIADLSELIQDPSNADLRSIRRGLAASMAFFEMDSK
jgi:hypothetical protein